MSARRWPTCPPAHRILYGKVCAQCVDEVLAARDAELAALRARVAALEELLVRAASDLRFERGADDDTYQAIVAAAPAAGRTLRKG